MDVQIHILDLKDSPALIADYDFSHHPGNVPQAVLHSLCEADIEAMQIYRCGNRLVMLTKTGENYDADRKASDDAHDPHIRAWEEKMAKYQACAPDDLPGEKWKSAKLIFDLAQHQIVSGD